MEGDRVALILGAIRDLLTLAEKVEELVDPDEKTLVDDMVIGFLKKLVERLV